jgi:hypothetical protein
VRGTGEIFELIGNVKKMSENINFYISIYLGAGIGIRDIKFLKKYKVPAERADREIMTDIKNSARPQSLSKRRKLICLWKLNILKINLKNDFGMIRINYN